MGYVAVKGGTHAIEESIKQLKYERLRKGSILDVKDIEAGMRGLVDQVMSESSLYSEQLAALAIKQAEGNPEEAVFLLRAYRSTLPRKHYSKTVYSEDMRVKRRISASFKDIPGGQILGAATDYTHRLLDFSLAEEKLEEAVAWIKEFQEENELSELPAEDLSHMTKVIDYLRREGLMAEMADNAPEPDDVTRKGLEFPSSRSERLQILSRGQTGAVTSFAYSVIRGYGALHPTVGELRVGMLPVTIQGPEENASDEDDYYIGSFSATEAEMLMPVNVEKAHGQNEIQFEIGYGICYGQNETKAISIAILDHCLENPNNDFPAHNEEFVLYHIDSVEATGFISHLKMPHYVTFQSKLDSVRKTSSTKKDSREGAEMT